MRTRLITTMLLTAAALDLTRCGLALTAARHPVPGGLALTAARHPVPGGVALAAARHPVPVAGLVAAGLAAAALTVGTAHGCRAGRRWAGWAALVIGAASDPQASASGFRSPYTIPDIATAALGILLATTILATAGRTAPRDATPKSLSAGGLPIGRRT